MKEDKSVIFAKNASWTFGGDVSKNFESHIEKSVPGYRLGHNRIANVSDFFLQDGSVVYELGCSTGALLRQLAERNKDKNVKLVGVEIVLEMVQKAEITCQEFSNVAIEHCDLMQIDYEPADMIISYYTMQFLRPSVRQLAFNRVYDALNWGGAFVLYEKVRGPDARFQDILTTLHTDFKLQNGSTEIEIVNKMRSLKGVLEPFSSAGNMGLLERAGFKDSMVIFKDLCFEGVLAIK